MNSAEHKTQRFPVRLFDAKQVGYYSGRIAEADFSAIARLLKSERLRLAYANGAHLGAMDEIRRLPWNQKYKNGIETNRLLVKAERYNGNGGGIWHPGEDFKHGK